MSPDHNSSDGVRVCGKAIPGISICPNPTAEELKEHEDSKNRKFADTIDHSKDASWTALLSHLTLEGGQTKIECDDQTCKGAVITMDRRNNGGIAFLVETYTLDKKTLLSREVCGAEPDGSDKQCDDWDAK
jgi:hypothetical protein